jgi:hypothetical protein
MSTDEESVVEQNQISKDTDDAIFIHAQADNHIGVNSIANKIVNAEVNSTEAIEFDLAHLTIAREEPSHNKDTEKKGRFKIKNVPEIS